MTDVEKENLAELHGCGYSITSVRAAIDGPVATVMGSRILEAEPGQLNEERLVSLRMQTLK